MRIDRIHEYLTTTIVIIVGLVAAILCGKMTASGEAKILASVLIGSGWFALALVLRSRLWLVLLFVTPLSGTLPFLNIPFRLCDVLTVLIFLSFLAFTALRVPLQKVKYTLFDLVLFLNLLNLLTVYLRNPVGSKATGAAMVGGRPYFNIFVAAVAYLVYQRAPASIRDGRRMPWIIALSTAFATLPAMLTMHFPKVGFLGDIYSGFAPPPPDDPTVFNDGIDRKIYLVDVARPLALWLASYYRPITLYIPFYPIRFICLVFAFIAALLSGFRTAVISCFEYTVLATYLRRRYMDLVIMFVAGFFLVAFLGICNGKLFTLPLAAQRALSFMPGNWDSMAVQEAEGSTNWRVEMWKMVLTEDKWIHSKWFGDGFGFSANDLAVMEAMQDGGGGFAGGSDQEAFMISGTFHSGPLTTIRTVGYVGLILFFGLMGMMCNRAWKMIGRARDTELFPMALFVGIPILLKPFEFVFVFGSFDTDCPAVILSAGILLMAERAVARAAERRDERLSSRAVAPQPVRSVFVASAA